MVIVSVVQAYNMGSEQSGKKKTESERGNLGERELKKEVNELKQMVSRTCNELCWRRQWRKATAKKTPFSRN